MSFASTGSLSCFTASTHFRFASAISTKRRRNTSSVGRENWLPINRSTSSHIPDSEAQTKAARELGEAFARYFGYRADLLQRDLNELFRVGRRSLAVGVTILIACLASAHVVSGYLVEFPFRRLVEESFLILGWVANWRPLEIFLYDWWPLVRRRDLYRRLSEAAVETKPYPNGQSQIPMAGPA